LSFCYYLKTISLIFYYFVSIFLKIKLLVRLLFHLSYIYFLLFLNFIIEYISNNISLLFSLIFLFQWLYELFLKYLCFWYIIMIIFLIWRCLFMNNTLRYSIIILNLFINILSLYLIWLLISRWLLYFQLLFYIILMCCILFRHIITLLW